MKLDKLPGIDALCSIVMKSGIIVPNCSAIKYMDSGLVYTRNEVVEGTNEAKEIGLYFTTWSEIKTLSQVNPGFEAES